MINWIIIIGAAIAGSLSRFFQMKQAAFLSGADAYYYALQIKFFAQTGALKIPESSPLLPLMGWTAKLGWSYEFTIILWTVFIQFACAICVLIAYRLIQGKNHISVVLPLLFSWVILCPTLAFICIEFPKYAFSLIFLPLWPVGLVNKRLWPVSLGAVILSCISHLTMIGLLFLVLLGFIIIGISGLNFSFLKRPVILWGAVGLILACGLILGKFFLIADLKRIQLEGLQPILWTYFSRKELPLLLKAEVMISGIISAILVFSAIKDRSKTIFRFWSPFILFLLFVPLGSQEVMGIPERLCLILPFITVCSLIGVQKRVSVSVEVSSYSVVCLVFILITLFPKVYLNIIHSDCLNPDYQLYDQVTKAIADHKSPMLIAHQGLNYYYKYQTMKESFPYEPESHWPKKKIWRIVYGVTPSEWAYYLPEKWLWGSGLLFSLPGPYSLIREDCWNEFRNNVKSCSNDDFKSLVFDSWLNPSQPRPEFARERAEKDKNGEFSAYPIK